MPRNVEVVVFKGISYRRYPDSKQWSLRSYYTPTPKYRRLGIQRLHQEIWKDANGPIPEGHHIHHKDGNTLNNDASNLESIDPDRHYELHVEATPLIRKILAAKRLGRYRKAAADWHRSEEGRAVHREIGRESWEGREFQGRICEYCGEAFRTRDRRKATRFCSLKCRVYARKRRGDDDEDRICPICDATFRISRFVAQKTCSRICGQRLRHDPERLGLQSDG